MGISDVEGHTGQFIAICQYNMLHIGPRYTIMNHYSALVPWQLYHTPKATLDGADICMIGDVQHDGDYPVLMVMQGNPSLSGDATCFVWVPDG